MTPPEIIQAMIEAALEAADPYKLTQTYLQDQPILGERIFLVSVGKAAVAMAKSADKHLPIHQGVVISKLPEADFSDNIQYFQGSHPIPDQRSLNGTTAVREMLAQTTQQDHVLCLISGGASALFTAPQLPLADWQQLNDALLGCGCTINEINLVRQHLDEVKGGGLLNWITPSPNTTLILSDVIGNDLSFIGSGPTVLTVKNYKKATQILDAYQVWERLTESTQNTIKRHLDRMGNLNGAYFPSANNIIIGDVKKSAEKAAKVAERYGFKASVQSTTLTGEAKNVGQELANTLISLPSKTCYVYGGETTVTLGENPGTGGRNQALALSAVIALAEKDKCWLATLATDGEDGPNEGAGAIVSGKTARQANQLGLTPQAYLNSQDSYTFFNQLEQGHIRIGSTGTNVNDITILLKE